MRQTFDKIGRSDNYKFETLSLSKSCIDFECSIPEYNDYLTNDALRSQNDHIALTWLLAEQSTGKIASYMSLIMDAIKITGAEKELHNLNYPFRTIPAMKIAKLAVDNSFSEKYKGILAFYEKNGFIPNTELYNKNRATISMRKDIYK